MIFYTFLINAALARLASLLVTPTYLAKFDIGEPLGLKAFFAAIIGGFNQIRGALAGGLLVGVIENLAAAYVSTAYRDAVPLILLIAHDPVQAAGPAGQPRGAQGLMPARRAAARPRGARLLALPPVALRIAVPYPGLQELRHLPPQLLAGVRDRGDGPQPDVGYAGQESLAHAAFIGIGAYTTAHPERPACHSVVALPRRACCFVDRLAARLPGAARAEPLPRLRHARLHTAVWLVLRNEEWLTGGSSASTTSRGRRSSAGLDATTSASTTSCSAITSLAAFVLWGCCARPGAGPSRRCATTRSAPRASASTSGLHPALLRDRLGYAGLAGALFAPLVQFIDPARSRSARPDHDADGGGRRAGYFFGPLLGSAVGVLLPEWLRFAQALVPVHLRRRR